jgi:hypothetical protein
MRGRDNVGGAIVRRHLQHRQSLVKRFGPVVQTGQDVTMDVNQKEKLPL